MSFNIILKVMILDTQAKSVCLPFRTRSDAEWSELRNSSSESTSEIVRKGMGLQPSSSTTPRTRCLALTIRPRTRPSSRPASSWSASETFPRRWAHISSSLSTVNKKLLKTLIMLYKRHLLRAKKSFSGNLIIRKWYMLYNNGQFRVPRVRTILHWGAPLTKNIKYTRKASARANQAWCRCPYSQIHLFSGTWSGDRNVVRLASGLGDGDVQHPGRLRTLRSLDSGGDEILSWRPQSCGNDRNYNNFYSPSFHSSIS